MQNYKGLQSYWRLLNKKKKKKMYIDIRAFTIQIQDNNIAISRDDNKKNVFCL